MACLFQCEVEFGFMTILHLREMESTLDGGGAGAAISQQEKAYIEADIDFTTDPSDDYEMVIINTFGLKSFYYLIKSFLGSKKVITHAHTTKQDFQDSFIFSNILAPFVGVYTGIFYRLSNKVVAPSDYTKSLLEKREVRDISVVSNGIDSSKLDGFRNHDLGDELELKGELTVVNLGTVLERKGLSDFISVAEEFEDLDFVWPGPVPEKLLPRKTMKLINSCPDNVYFPGYVESIKDIFGEADIFFYPTREENQGIAVYEAAYCELPIVLRDLPVFDSYFENEENCLKGNSVEDFVNLIQKLEDDNELRNDLGDAAKEMSKKHRLNKIGEKLKNAYGLE